MASSDTTTRARVLFDEAHSEAWSIRARGRRADAAVASRRRVASGAPRGARAARLRGRAPTTAGPLDADAPRRAPTCSSSPIRPSRAGRRPPATGSPRLGGRGDRGDRSWVEARRRADRARRDRAGEVRQQPQRAARPASGSRSRPRPVQDYEHHREAPSWVLADLVQPDGRAARGGRPARRASTRPASTAPGRSRVGQRRAGARAHLADGGAAARAAGRGRSSTAPGRVVVLADSDLFGDDCIEALDHEALWVNLVYWAAARGVRRRGESAVPSAAAADPAWPRLRDAVEELRLLQEPDGSVEPRAATTIGCASWSTTIAAPVAARSRRTSRTRRTTSRRSAPTCAAWADGGFGKPDFTALARGVPARAASAATASSTSSCSRCTSRTARRDTCFEALIVRVPWPRVGGRARARATTTRSSCRSTFVDYTSGYDSECAVLFPETFSVAERPPAYFGAIFCDREAERFRRVVRRRGRDPAARTCRPTPPRCSAREELSRDAYIAWDLIHDRTHMRGDLPFDPFMIRQRSPYWMYSLEELRCDLTAFGEAVELEARGLPARPPRAVRDPLRPPVPLPGHRRARAQLRRPRRPAAVRVPAPRGLPALDRQPAGDRVGHGSPRASQALRDRGQELYHSGIDRSKLGQWIAAHDLVADVRAAGRGLGLGARAPRASRRSRSRSSSSTWSRDDEFPLSLFYTQLKPKLEPVLARRPRARRGGGGGLMGELDGRVIAIAGAGGGLGPARRAALRRRRARRWR